MPYARTAEEVQTAVDEMVRRIAEQFAPERIILFGSYARGEAGPDSDVDLLVVMRPAGSQRAAATAIDRAFLGIPLAADVIVATPEQVEAGRERVGSVIQPALREGKLLYERAA